MKVKIIILKILKVFWAAAKDMSKIFPFGYFFRKTEYMSSTQTYIDIVESYLYINV